MPAEQWDIVATVGEAVVDYRIHRRPTMVAVCTGSSVLVDQLSSCPIGSREHTTGECSAPVELAVPIDRSRRSELSWTLPVEQLVALVVVEAVAAAVSGQRALIGRRCKHWAVNSACSAPWTRFDWAGQDPWLVAIAVGPIVVVVVEGRQTMGQLEQVVAVAAAVDLVLLAGILAVVVGEFDGNLVVVPIEFVAVAGQEWSIHCLDRRGQTANVVAVACGDSIRG